MFCGLDSKKLDFPPYRKSNLVFHQPSRNAAIKQHKCYKCVHTTNNLIGTSVFFPRYKEMMVNPLCIFWFVDVIIIISSSCQHSVSHSFLSQTLDPRGLMFSCPVARNCDGFPCCLWINYELKLCSFVFITLKNNQSVN